VELDVVVAALRSAGYPLVRSDVPLEPGTGRFRADVVAWGPDSSGELVPLVTVEVKKRHDPGIVSQALRQLEVARELLGTREHYVVSGDVWYAADAGLLEAYQVPGPSQVVYTGPVEITDPTLVTDLLLRRVLRVVEQGRENSFIAAAEKVARESLTSGGLLIDGSVIAVPQAVLADALFNGLLTWMTRARPSNGQYLTTPPVGAVLGRLLEARGGVVLDPFCGSASLLWHAAQCAQGSSRLELVGRDINEETVRLAQLLADLLPGSHQIALGDSLRDELPKADYVITEPPIGLRLDGARQLSDGSFTKSGDVIVIDRCIAALRPGGRAVLHTGRAWTWQEQASQFRGLLRRTVRVSALIGLPGGLFPGSSIDSVIVVIERKPPTRTFVAQLGGDWATQLSDGGAALSAYRNHMLELG
jgi:SAM-dependent methyltransferase